MVMAGPGITPGAELDDVSMLDLAPTAAALLGLLVARVSGLAGKTMVRTEVISPELLLGYEGATTVEQLLAGA